MADDDAEGGGVVEKKVLHRVISDGTSNTNDRRVVVRATGPAECKLNADGSMHREMTLNINENGVESQGKLILDITK